ncbi:lysozyme inhibitor LprI family protein [Erwiniaceae bacterium L1_54_6]|jgi:uncharacterized protein YecT (DUF1311 family)|nr:lysozyme inhibitor LprI family protein [Erwiniaceae bacterium L1_54_6]
MRGFIISFGALFISFYANADSNNYSSAFHECMSKSEGVTVEMRDCYEDEVSKQDARLNSNYKKYISDLPLKVKKEFVDAQRQWIKFRDANCGAFISEQAGGTLALLVGDSCYLKMTANRADDFTKN